MAHGPSPAPPSVRWIGRTAVVELGGELDILVAPAVAGVLEGLTSGQRPHVLVDLTGCTFLDCSGLAPLNRARARAKAAGGRLTLVTGNPRVLRVLQLTRLARHFTVRRTVAQALVGMDRVCAGV